MNDDSIQLIKEVDSGCLMAINSLHQMEEYEIPKAQNDMITRYIAKHNELQKEASRLLHNHNETDKQPGMMASAMSWLTTEMKLMIHENTSEISKIMMNGCNMGIQSIREQMSKYKGAEAEAIKLAEKLIKVEEDMFSDAKEFI